MAGRVMAVVAGTLVLASVAGASRAAPSVVTHVLDGDTIRLSGGVRVRLLQIDAPERGACYSSRARAELRKLLPAAVNVDLQADPRLDRVDQYGRLLRYVFRGRTNVNLALVARGAATVYFYGGERGRYAGALRAAEERARARRLGLWAACPTEPRTRVRARCDPAYPTVCIPSPPPDLDCRDIRHRNFRVRQPDPHRFDGGGDGWGCERR